MRRSVSLIGIAVLIGLAWLIAGRESGQGPAQPCLPEGDDSPAASSPPAVVALLGDEIEDSGEFAGPHVQRLLRISLPGAEVQAERPVGRRLPNRAVDRDDSYRLNVARAPLLAATPSGKAVIVLVKEPAAGRDRLVVVDAATLETRCTHLLEKDVRYSGLMLGRSGRAYAYGAKRRGAPGRWDAVLTIADTETGAVAASHTLRRAERGYRRDAGRDWYPYGGALSPDERRIVVSYHGGDTTGADVFAVSRDSDVPGSPRTPVGIDIELAHGAVAAHRTGFVAAAAQHGLLQLDRDGRVVRRLPVAPKKSHLMDLAVDSDRSLIYVSTCGTRARITRLDLARDRRETLPTGPFCGSPLAVHGDRFLVLSASRVGKRGYAAIRPQRLRVIDLQHPGSGERVRRLGAPLDALAVGGIRPAAAPR